MRVFFARPAKGTTTSRMVAVRYLFERHRLAEADARTKPLSRSEIEGVWQRHPEFAPGGPYYKPPRRA